MPTVTLGDLQGRVYNRLEANTAFYPLPQVTTALNNAVKVLNLITGFLQHTETLYTSPNRLIYNVPQSILIPIRMEMDGAFVPKNGFKSLCHANPGWMNETSDSTGMGPYHWCPVGITKFILHPADSRGGKIISLTGVSEPEPLVNTTDTIGFPNEFSDSLENYAAHILMMKCGGTVAVQSMYAYGQFLSRANELKRFKSKIGPVFRVAEVVAEDKKE